MVLILPLAVLSGIIAWLLRPQGWPSGVVRTAILITIGLALIGGVTAVTLQITANLSGLADLDSLANAFFIAGLSLVPAAAIASGVLLVIRQKAMAKGMGFAVCISLFVSILVLAGLELLAGE